jgi:hypothetical protein
MIGNSHIGEILELNDNTILHQSDNISKILGAEINHQLKKSQEASATLFQTIIERSLKGEKDENEEK